MGRRSRSRALSIWANGERVGTWVVPARGEMELHYDASWRRSSAGRPLSLSLPFGVGDAPLKGERVENYFDNLLPDSPEIRRRIATRYKTDTMQAFDLLRSIGRDCVGAVQLLGENDAPENVHDIEGTPLSEEDIEHLLRAITGPVLDANDDEDFRISLAGAQEKTALLHHAGRWMRPHGATPTTHILKLPLGLVGNRKVDLQTSVENEWLCLAILRAYGLPVADAQIATFGREKALCVKRFDRGYGRTGTLLRLPQEDFCQALGVAPHRKYEAHGGPGVRDIAGILQQSERAREDLETFLSAQILFWMLAAPDGHAKNFSIRLLAGGRFQLTPLYDVMSIWPVQGDANNQWSWHKAPLAMAMWGRSKHYKMRDIKRGHFNTTARLCHYGPDAEPLITRLIARTPDVIASVSRHLPTGFPERVAVRVFEGLQRCVSSLEATASAAECR